VQRGTLPGMNRPPRRQPRGRRATLTQDQLWADAEPRDLARLFRTAATVGVPEPTPDWAQAWAQVVAMIEGSPARWAFGRTGGPLLPAWATGENPEDVLIRLDWTENPGGHPDLEYAMAARQRASREQRVLADVERRQAALELERLLNAKAARRGLPRDQSDCLDGLCSHGAPDSADTAPPAVYGKPSATVYPDPGTGTVWLGNCPISPPGSAQ